MPVRELLREPGGAVIRLLALIGAAALCVGFSSALRAAGPADSIETFISEEMPASGVPGVAYAVVLDGEVSAVGARGLVELGEPHEATADQCAWS